MPTRLFRRGRRTRLAALLALAATTVLPLPAAAQTAAWPTETVRIVVPFPPGGGVDVLARAVAAELTKTWGHTVIVENRAGAGSLIGAQFVARAKPDGHTLMATVNQTLVSNRFLYKNLGYDPVKDFAPITLLVQSDQMIVANVAMPAKDLGGLIAFAKQNPKALTYGSFANGSQPHLTFELLKQREGIDILHVPFNGVAPMLTALGGDVVALTTISGNVAAPLISAGKIKPIAVAGSQRLAQFPDVPTTAESGHGYLKTSIWYGLFAPAGTPAAIVDRIQADVKAILTEPKFAEQQAVSRGLRVVAGSPAQLAEEIRQEAETVAAIVKAANITAD